MPNLQLAGLPGLVMLFRLAVCFSRKGSRGGETLGRESVGLA